MQEETKEKVEKWLLDEFFKIEKHSDPNAFFNYGITFPNGLILNIIQPKKKEDSLAIIMGLNLSPEQQTNFVKKTNKERQAVIRKLLSPIQNTDFEFSISPSADKPQFIRLINPIFYDGLTKDRLMQSIRRTLNTFVAVLHIVQQELGVSKEEEGKEYVV